MLLFEDVRNHTHELFVYMVLKLIHNEVAACILK